MNKTDEQFGKQFDNLRTRNTELKGLIDILENMYHEQEELNRELDKERKISKLYYDKLENDLYFAGKIQKTLEIPEIIRGNSFNLYSRIIHCEDMAGDYIDYNKIEDLIYIISVDVSGHGLISSLFIFIIKAIIRTYLKKYISLEDLMGFISSEMKKYLVEDIFFTMNIIAIDIQGDKLDYITAGSPPFIVYNNTGYKLVKTISTFITNMVPEHWARGSIPFKSGDRLFIFSDGAFEIDNGKKGIIGVSFIKNFIKGNLKVNPEDVIDGLLVKLRGLRKDQKFEDDVSICIFERK